MIKLNWILAFLLAVYANQSMAQVPTANFTIGTTTICEGGSVSFTNTSLNATSYFWTFEDGNPATSNSENPVVTWSSSGSHLITLVASNDNGSDTQTQSITVDSSPLATITASGNTSFCNGGNIQLTVNSTIGASYQWKLNGNNIANANSTALVVSSTGIYSVVVTQNACSTISNAISVNVNQNPTVSIIPASSTIFCQGNSVNLNGTVNSNYTYQWRQNGVNIPGANNSSFAASASGTYSVVVTSNGCTGVSNSLNVNVFPLPAAAITAQGDTSFCSGSNVVLAANTGTGLTYKWKLNGNLISGATSSTFTASSSGSYTVQVTGNSCSANSNAINVEVLPLPTVTIIAEGNTTFCEGGSVHLLATSNPNYSYQWRKDGVELLNDTSNQLSAISSGNFSVLVTENSCSVISNSISVTANPNTQIVNQPISQTSCVGADIQLNVVANGLNLFYQWTFNGNTIPGANTNTLTINSVDLNDQGNYNVYILGLCGSIASDFVSLAVSNSLNISQQPQAQNLCVGETLNLSVVANGINQQYQWYFQGNQIEGATSSSLQISGVLGTNGGNYYVEINSDCGSSTSDVVAILVNDIPTAIVTIIGNSVVCDGDSVHLIGPNGSSYSYQWRKNNQLLNGSTNQNYFALQPGDYSVEVIENGCSSVSNAVTASFNSLPQSPQLTIFPSENVCEGDTIYVTSNYLIGNVWNIGGTEPVLKVVSSASVFCTHTDKNNCSSSSSVQVLNVNPIPQAPLITNNANGIQSNYSNGNQWYLNNELLVNDTNQSLVTQQFGTYTVCHTNAFGCSACSDPYFLVNTKDLINEIKISIWPNPFKESIQVYGFKENEIIQIKLFDSFGRLVYSSNNIHSNSQINIPEISEGIYFLNICKGNFEIGNYKLIKN